MRMRSYQVCQCGSPLQRHEGDTPEPQGTQVLLKVLAAGVCHSDLHIWFCGPRSGCAARCTRHRAGP